MHLSKQMLLQNQGCHFFTLFYSPYEARKELQSSNIKACRVLSCGVWCIPLPIKGTKRWLNKGKGNKINPWTKRNKQEWPVNEGLVYSKSCTTQCGGVCGLAVNTSNSGSGGPGFKPARRVVSLDKELYSPLSLFTQVYKWVPATYCWG